MSTYYEDLVNTTFPDVIDTINNKIDILSTDGAKIDQYQQYMQNGDFTNASAILNTIPNVSQKIITANDLNVYRDGLLALERFYKDDIQDYTSAKQAEWESIIDRFSYKGVYTYRQYYKNNIVSYSFNGRTLLYIATRDPQIGANPTNTNYWREFTMVGNKGDSGYGLAFRWEWEATTNYSVDDVVTYNNSVWGCIKVSYGNNVPADSSAYWENIMNISPATYPVQDSEPASKKAGDLWVQTFNTIGA